MWLLHFRATISADIFVSLCTSFDWGAAGVMGLILRHALLDYIMNGDAVVAHDTFSIIFSVRGSTTYGSNEFDVVRFTLYISHSFLQLFWKSPYAIDFKYFPTIFFYRQKYQDITGNSLILNLVVYGHRIQWHILMSQIYTIYLPREVSMSTLCSFLYMQGSWVAEQQTYHQLQPNWSCKPWPSCSKVTSRSQRSDWEVTLAKSSGISM